MKTSSEQRISEYTKNGWWTDHTLHGQLHYWAKETPNNLALVDQPNRKDLDGMEAQQLSYGQLDVASTYMAVQLLNYGVDADDVVVVQLPNVAELLVLYYAISKIGAVISPVPIQYGEHELQQIMDRVNPVAYITGTQFKQDSLSLSRKRLIAARPSTKLLCFGSDALEVDGILELNVSVSANDSSQLSSHQQSYDDDAHRVITICWTSGTTGTPKGVPRSHAMWFATARSSAEASSMEASDRLLNPFPAVNMAALGGFLFPAALHGCSLFLHHPIDVPVFLKQIEQEQITFTIAPPPLLNQLAKSSELWQQFDFSKLRAVGSGSAPLSPSMIEVFDNQYGKPVVNFYGSNEGISLFSTPASARDPEIRASMFPRLCTLAKDEAYSPTILTKVIDTATGIEIEEPGVAGELLISGPTVFDGYLDSDNSAVFDSSGYFRTGDLVEICGDPPNYYRIAGRCKDIINRGGMKISPSDIDILLEGLSQCSEAAVCAYADDRLGEKICACLVVDDAENKPTLQEVSDLLSEQGLAKFKLPERLEFFESLPRNPLGKVQRFVLQELVAERQQ